jgi:hypothetical protein
MLSSSSSSPLSLSSQSSASHLVRPYTDSSVRQRTTAATAVTTSTTTSTVVLALLTTVCDVVIIIIIIIVNTIVGSCFLWYHKPTNYQANVVAIPFDKQQKQTWYNAFVSL